MRHYRVGPKDKVMDERCSSSLEQTGGKEGGAAASLSSAPYVNLFAANYLELTHTQTPSHFNANTEKACVPVQEAIEKFPIAVLGQNHINRKALAEETTRKRWPSVTCDG